MNSSKVMRGGAGTVISLGRLAPVGTSVVDAPTLSSGSVECARGWRTSVIIMLLAQGPSRASVPRLAGEQASRESSGPAPRLRVRLCPHLAERLLGGGKRASPEPVDAQPEPFQ